MEALAVLAIIAGVIGIIGSIAPGLPGPPISWVGILFAYMAKNDPLNEISTTALIVWLIVTVVVTVLDYLVPAKLTTMTGGSKSASIGALIARTIYKVSCVVCSNEVVEYCILISTMSPTNCTSTVYCSSLKIQWFRYVLCYKI